MTRLDSPVESRNAEEGYSYDPDSNPPPFGHTLKKFWAFDDAYINLNNGSYGSLPLPVLSACSKLTIIAERNPDKWCRFGYIPLLNESRRLVADLIGAREDEVVMINNATHALNSVLRNFDWTDGDVILGASTTYNAIQRTVRYLADRPAPGRPTAYAVEYTFPTTNEQLLEAFRARIKEIKRLQADSRFTDTPGKIQSTQNKYEESGNKFVAIIDGMISNPGIRLPWKNMIEICKEEGVWSVIDGAHSIGQEMNINLGEIKPDFWISNCHKWRFAKRGCAVLYVPQRNQHIIKSSIPTSHAYPSPSEPGFEDTKFVLQHQWTGTMDEVNFLSVKAALEFRKWLGGEVAINNYCHALAIKGGKRLAEIMHTKLMDESGTMTCNMTNVLLPLPLDIDGSRRLYTPEINAEINAVFDQRLLYEWNVSAGHYFHAGGWWTRCSAQVWNEMSDFEYLGNAFMAICEDIEKTILQGRIVNSPSNE